MFVRTLEVKRGERCYRYLKVVESRRERGRTRQETLVNFGNVAHWPDARLRELVRLLARFVEMDLADLSDVRLDDCRQLGPYLALTALWENLGLDDLLDRALAHRKFDLPVAAYARAMVFNRLVEPRSKKAVWEWLARDAQIPGLDPEALPLHGYYRTLEYLQEAKRPVERGIHARLGHLFNRDVSLVFYDLTSSYFEGKQCSLARRGYSRDHRPDCVQIEIGLLVDGEGIPLGHEVFEGNVKDVTTVVGTLARLKGEFDVRRCVFVSDDGMASEANLVEIARQKYEYITSVSLGREGLPAELVATRPPWRTFTRLEENMWVQPLRQEGTVRYIASYNPERAASDRRHRKEHLRACFDYLRRLQEEPKGPGRRRKPGTALLSADRFVRRKGCAKLISLRQTPEGKLEWGLERAALRRAHRSDGLLVLKTNSETLTDEEVAHGYRTLWRVERAFRQIKDAIRLRPIRHWKDPRVLGHVFVCVLAYTLERLLEKQLGEARLELSAAAALEALRPIQVATLTLEEHQVRRRTEITPEQARILAAVGVNSVPEIW